MEHTLRCNALRCRRELKDRAIVTTCSHVFCLDCSNRLHLITPPSGQRRTCPACDAQLVNPDDAVIAELNPSEDYKTSVLSGLNPNIIMECAGRALSFWAYQTSQEIVYQEYLARTLTDKYSALNAEMDKVIHDANAEISDLRGKLANLQVDQDNLRHKNEELVQALRDKTRKHMQTQELYDKLKRRAMLGQVQSAASDAVDYTIQNTVAGNRTNDSINNEIQQLHHSMILNGTQDHPISAPEPETSIPISSASLRNTRLTSDETWSGGGVPGRPQQEAIFMQTPSIPRQRLPGGSAMNHGYTIPQIGLSSATPMLNRRESSSHRSPLKILNPNITGVGSFPGYGLSAGVKVSHPPGSPQTLPTAGKPIHRSRVVQRSASTIGGYRLPTTQPNGGANMFHVPGNRLYEGQ